MQTPVFENFVRDTKTNPNSVRCYFHNLLTLPGRASSASQDTFNNKTEKDETSKKKIGKARRSCNKIMQIRRRSRQYNQGLDKQ